MDFLKKIQNQPENVRKIILWAALTVVGAILIIFWVLHSVKAVNNFSKADFWNKLNISKMQSDASKSIEDIKQKASDLENIKQKAEDILNDAEIEKMIEDKINASPAPE